MSRMVSFLILVSFVVLIGILFYRVMANFLVPLFLATLLVVIFTPVHNWLVRKCRGRRYPAAGLSTLAILLVVLVPSVWLVTLAVFEGASVVAELDAQTINRQLTELRQRLGMDIPHMKELREIESDLKRLDELAGDELHDAERLIDNLHERLDRLRAELGQPDTVVPPEELRFLRGAVWRLERAEPGTVEFEEARSEVQSEYRQFKMILLGGPYRAWLRELANPGAEQLEEWGNEILRMIQEWLVSITGVTTVFVFRTLLGTVILIVSLFFFLADGPAMIQTVKQLLPLDDRYVEELIDEFARISRGVVLATLLSALVQGLLAGVGFGIAGLDALFLLTLLTIVFAIIPVLGPMMVWLPASLWLFFYEERVLAATMLALYGALIVSQADNVVRPLVLRGHSKLHPLLALLSVLGGVQVLGPIGILVGPMIVVFLQVLLKILHRELTSLEQTGPLARGDSVPRGGTSDSGDPGPG